MLWQHHASDQLSRASSKKLSQNCSVPVSRGPSNYSLLLISRFPCYTTKILLLVPEIQHPAALVCQPLSQYLQFPPWHPNQRAA